MVVCYAIMCMYRPCGDTLRRVLRQCGHCALTDKNALTVKYGDTSATGGAVLKPAQTASPPTIEYEAEPGAFYTLVMTDPDAPSRANPLFREFVHWVVVDIPGSDVGNGITLAAYNPAAPPHNAGLHRYVFLLYKQTGPSTHGNTEVPVRLDMSVLKAARKYFKPRGGLSANKWASEANIGPLKAVDCFQGEWDESVDAVHEAIGFMPPDPYKSPKQQAAAQ